MNKPFYFFIVAVSLTACQANSGNRGEPVVQPSGTPGLNVSSAPTTITMDTNKKVATTTTMPVTPETKTKTPLKNGTALNPAHGQPGHRCDIPEGAPLNSPAATNATAPVNNKNISVQTVAPPKPAKSKLRINPAHGEPGHDCAVQVGQPLKS